MNIKNPTLTLNFSLLLSLNMEFGMQTEPVNYVRNTVIFVSQELQNILLG
jgi:hypothetical protein